jgi:DNA-binding LacI/PurR family transcriptional regulator
MPARRQPASGEAKVAVTLDDVARRAGVHTATVSRALSRPELVNKQTLARVLAAADELDYHPNLAARRLVTGRTGTIGVVVPDIANPFFGGFIRELQDALRLTGQAVTLADSRHDADIELDAVAWLRGQVDAVIVCGSVAPAARLHAAAGTQPVMLLNRQIRGTSSVVVDQRAVAELTIDHLVGLGHRSITYVAGPAHYWSSRQRRAHIEKVAAQHRLDLQVVKTEEATFEAGLAIVEQVRPTPATAVIAFNDLLAVGVVQGLRAASVAVPKDVSVVGCDGIDLARMVDPPLTTVAAPPSELAAAVVALLADAKHGSAQRVAPTLVIGGTTVAKQPRNPRRPHPS